MILLADVDAELDEDPDALLVLRELELEGEVLLCVMEHDDIVCHKPIG